jgi:hypothetical protein
MNQMLSGAIVVASLIAALFFLRFWHQTRDRFFLYFALSFTLEAGNRVALALIEHATEDNPLFYTLRVLAYGLIVAAIWQKNRRGGGSTR